MARSPNPPTNRANQQLLSLLFIVRSIDRIQLKQTENCGPNCPSIILLLFDFFRARLGYMGITMTI